MLIYINTCSFNRPFDDRMDLIVRSQTEAKLYVQDMIRTGKLSLAWSAVMDVESSVKLDINRKIAVGDWKKLHTVYVPLSQSVKDIASEWAQIGVKPIVALHVASAIEAQAEYFLTTDKALLRIMAQNTRLRVVDPIDFLRALKEIPESAVQDSQMSSTG